MTHVRLKIDESLTADRVCPQGCGQRGWPAWTQARPPTRQADGIRRMNRVATIFPPRAGIVKGVAENALYTFTGIDVSEKQ